MQFAQAGKDISYSIVYELLEEMAKDSKILEYILNEYIVDEYIVAESEYIPYKEKAQELRQYILQQKDPDYLYKLGSLAIENGNTKFLEFVHPILITLGAICELEMLVDESIDKDSPRSLDVFITPYLNDLQELAFLMRKAIINNNINIVRYLYYKGVNSVGDDIIYLIIHHRNIEMLEVLIDLDLVSEKDALGYTGYQEKDREIQEFIKEKFANKRRRESDILSSEFPEKTDPESSK